MPTGQFGVPNAICDRCGFAYALTELRKEWTGLMVCHDCRDPRHPQEFVRGRRPDKAPLHARPVGTYTFIDTNDVSADDL
jgi:hypothetical protein